MKQKSPENHPAQLPGKKAGSRGDAARQKIIAAAEKVFTKHSFHAVSIRMIGKEGGFDFSIIHHHFNKAQLFEAVAEKLYEELVAARKVWFEGLDSLPYEMRMVLFLDRTLDYFFQNPESLKILSLNMGDVKWGEGFPGFESFTRFFKETEKKFLKRNPFLSPSEKVSELVYNLIVMITTFIGNSQYHGQTMGLEPDSKEYRIWVKKNLVNLFETPLIRLFEQSLRNKDGFNQRS